MSRVVEKNFNSHITKSQGTQERSIHWILSYALKRLLDFLHQIYLFNFSKKLYAYKSYW